MIQSAESSFGQVSEVRAVRLAHNSSNRVACCLFRRAAELFLWPGVPAEREAGCFARCIICKKVRLAYASCIYTQQETCFHNQREQATISIPRRVANSPRRSEHAAKGLCLCARKRARVTPRSKDAWLMIRAKVNFCSSNRVSDGRPPGDLCGTPLPHIALPNSAACIRPRASDSNLSSPLTHCFFFFILLRTIRGAAEKCFGFEGFNVAG